MTLMWLLLTFKA